MCEQENETAHRIVGALENGIELFALLAALAGPIIALLVVIWVLNR